MDSISRGCLLAYLKANPDMTYRDIIEFIEGMQPMEVDGAGPIGLSGVIREQEGQLSEALASGNTEYSLWPGYMG